MNPAEPAGEALLSLRGVGKTYPARARGMARLARVVTRRPEQDGVRVLDGVDLDLARGEAVGIVGRNGAGKSTLLQIACGMLQPSDGTVSCTGRIAAMLELGAGFKPEFSGRENVVLNAALYGLDEATIAERLPRIAAFADIGGYFDRPVSEYSSGMFARLAFAVCAYVDADILVVDEVLAVGDGAFQTKCRRFMEDFLTRGAVLFVSHDENLVLSVCNRAIWLEAGRPVASGAPQEVLRRYRHAVELGGGDGMAMPHAGERPQHPPLAGEDARRGRNAIAVSPFLADAPSHGNGGAIIDDVRFADPDGRRLERLDGGETVSLVFEGRALHDLERPIAGFIFRDRGGQNMFGDNTYLAYRDAPVAIAAGQRFRAVLEFDMPLLPDGIYSVAPSLIEGTQRNHVHLFWMEEALVLTVDGSPVSIGKIGVPTRIECDVLEDEDTAARPLVAARKSV
jgi:lipopolysaccharide transport system ATP-binding protein